MTTIRTLPCIAFDRIDLSRDPSFIARVMAKWDEKKDTVRIAAELMTAEEIVASALARGREQRRAQA